MEDDSMPPMAIRDDVQHHTTVEMIDRLMRIENLSRGQSDYLERWLSWWRSTKPRDMQLISAI